MFWNVSVTIHVGFVVADLDRPAGRVPRSRQGHRPFWHRMRLYMTGAELAVAAAPATEAKETEPRRLHGVR